MLDSKGFDDWADSYDQSVAQSDEQNEYPFAGYQQLQERLFELASERRPAAVLDIGFGTGTLAARLYEAGQSIYGQDNSPRMLELAQQKMPQAKLCLGDIGQGLCAELKREGFYDSIIAGYSLHHLSQSQKLDLIRSLLPLLRPQGRLLIADVAFPDAAAQEECRRRFAELWDEDEIYFLADEMRQSFPAIRFEQVSYCSGLFILDAEG